MQLKAANPEQYIELLPENRKQAFIKLRQTIIDNLPEGFSETMSYGMIGYVIPHSLYPSGYHADPAQPLPFINIASQKDYIAFYHMGLYANKPLLEWFTKAYPEFSKTKLDMGKSCIRFRNSDQIPFPLIGELITKISAKDWIRAYESNLKRAK
jgi:Domain of unknown function (DU1801)